MWNNNRQWAIEPHSFHRIFSLHSKLVIYCVVFPLSGLQILLIKNIADILSQSWNGSHGSTDTSIYRLKGLALVKYQKRILQCSSSVSLHFTLPEKYYAQSVESAHQSMESVCIASTIWFVFVKSIHIKMNVDSCLTATQNQTIKRTSNRFSLSLNCITI